MFRKFVIKIPKFKQYNLFLSGVLANVREYKHSKLNKVDFAIVYWHSPLYFISVMERAEILSNGCDWLEFQEFIENKYKDNVWYDVIINDMKPNNFGYIGDRLVKVDYGV